MSCQKSVKVRDWAAVCELQFAKLELAKINHEQRFGSRFVSIHICQSLFQASILVLEEGTKKANHLLFKI